MGVEPLQPPFLLHGAGFGLFHAPGGIAPQIRQTEALPPRGAAQIYAPLAEKHHQRRRSGQGQMRPAPQQAPRAVAQTRQRQQQSAPRAGEALFLQIFYHIPPQGQRQQRLHQQKSAHHAEAQVSPLRPHFRQGEALLRRRDARQQHRRNTAPHSGSPVAAAQPLLLKFRVVHGRLLHRRGRVVQIVQIAQIVRVRLAAVRRFFLRQAAEKLLRGRQPCPTQGGAAASAVFPLLLLPLLLPLGGLLLHHGGHRPIHHVLHGHQPLLCVRLLRRLVLRRLVLRRLVFRRLLSGRFFRHRLLHRRLRRRFRRFRLRLFRLLGRRARRSARAELRQNVVQRKFLRHGCVPQQLACVCQRPIQFFLRVFAHSPRFTSGGAPPHITRSPLRRWRSGTKCAPSWECSPESRISPAPAVPCRCPRSR